MVAPHNKIEKVLTVNRETKIDFVGSIIVYYMKLLFLSPKQLLMLKIGETTVQS